MGDLRALVDEHAVWCAPLRDVAAWVREQRDARSWPLRLEQD